MYNCTSGGATGDVAVAADLWAGLHTVAGLDIGYRSDGTTPHGEHTQDKAFACMAVLSFPDMKVCLKPARNFLARAVTDLRTERAADLRPSTR